MRVDGEHAGRGDAERVSIRGGLGHGSNTNIAAGPRSILDHNRLMQLFRNCRLKRADHDVGAAAGRKGDDDLDRLIGICRSRARSEQRQA